MGQREVAKKYIWDATFISAFLKGGLGRVRGWPPVPQVNRPTKPTGQTTLVLTV